jgi:guanylate kinase
MITIILLITYLISLLFAMNSMKLSKSLVICGPSGVGKGSIIGELLKLHPDKVGLSVSHTTRLPRPGEICGTHYHFVKKEWMAEKINENSIDKNFFIEHANVHGNLYGTSRKAVEFVQSQSKVCILDVDVQGVKQIKKSNFLGKYIFIAPPSIQSLEQRLRLRGTESEEQMNLRLKNANIELEYGYTTGNFDEIIVNDDLNTAIRRVESIILEILTKSQ